MGWGQSCLCVILFLGEKGNTLPENLRKLPGQSEDSPGIVLGQSRENFVYVRFLVYWLSGPNNCVISASRSFEVASCVWRVLEAR